MNRFKIIKHSEGYSFSLLAQNGAVILRSETYHTKSACDQAVEEFPRYAKDEGFYHRSMDNAGLHFFYLKDKAGSIIATSEGYASISGLENGIYSVRQAVSEALAYS